MARLATAFLVFVFGALGAAPAFADEVTAVRFGAHADYTRIVIETSEPVTARAYTLSEPVPRLVVSFDAASWNVAGLSNAAGRGTGGVGAFRFDREALSPRIVFNLDQPYTVTQELSLEPNGGGWRTVVDIAPAAEATFQRLSGFPAPELTLDDILMREVGVLPPSCEAIKVVVDPGHGGRDPGATARFGGLHEKDIALAAGLELRDLLRATGRYQVTMTRDTDVFVDLYERVDIARRANANLFISLHADASPNSSGPSGATIYSMNPRAVARARDRAERNGDWVDSNRPEEVTEILRDMVVTLKQSNSEQFADALRTEVGRAGPLWKDTPMQANFAVLTDPEVPAVLFEMGFMTNRADSARLNNANERRRLMNAALAAIESHFAYCGGGEPAPRYVARNGSGAASTAR
ncbi:MAG: N-acetylmuramoyl-L-alanine amidase [Oceanicaulis sp.]